jgi:hypothetical protein
MAGLGDLWWSAARSQMSSPSGGCKRRRLGGVLLHGRLEWRAARHGRARGRGGRLNRGARLLVTNG